jgi:hypothetical protein
MDHGDFSHFVEVTYPSKFPGTYTLVAVVVVVALSANAVVVHNLEEVVDLDILEVGPVNSDTNHRHGRVLVLVFAPLVEKILYIPCDAAMVERHPYDLETILLVEVAQLDID